jgi:hypothetical protein
VSDLAIDDIAEQPRCLAVELHQLYLLNLLIKWREPRVAHPSIGLFAGRNSIVACCQL